VCGQGWERTQINSQEWRQLDLLQKEMGKDFLEDEGKRRIIAKGFIP
jgi:hypothetical protein